MRRGIAADAPLSDAGEERLSEEDRRALKMRVIGQNVCPQSYAFPR